MIYRSQAIRRWFISNDVWNTQKFMEVSSYTLGGTCSDNTNDESYTELRHHTIEVGRWNMFIVSHSYYIPNEMRFNAWFTLSGARDLIKKNSTVYHYLTTVVHVSTPSYRQSKQQIVKDLRRSFGSITMFEKCGAKLRRILMTHPHFTQGMPAYTQGMNYIAAFIIKQQQFEPDDKTCTNNQSMHEAAAFWTFTTIMSRVGELFGSELLGFHKAIECFNAMFAYHASQALVSHLKRENVMATIFNVWYHTLFTHPGMNEKIAKRIWNVFIATDMAMDFGVMQKISYLVLIRHKARLMNMEFIQITSFCKSRQCFVVDGCDDHDLIYRASRLQLNELYLKPIRDLKYVEHDEAATSIANRLWSYFKALSF
eukprot:336462_1